eukprot:TRINITY_DN37156_c0_g1_i1.p1 TRINITY_DN37156_c0_g1~~TRINITY_DN37156_c0_g1_i1.p1  ORF type:complete len:518 (+),score=132.50 TRINITY_DN37156_c0_g1_i1:65-1555(+)
MAREPSACPPPDPPHGLPCGAACVAGALLCGAGFLFGWMLRRHDAAVGPQTSALAAARELDLLRRRREEDLELVVALRKSLAAPAAVRPSAAAGGGAPAGPAERCSALAALAEGRAAQSWDGLRWDAEQRRCWRDEVALPLLRQAAAARAPHPLHIIVAGDSTMMDVFDFLCTAADAAALPSGPSDQQAGGVRVQRRKLHGPPCFSYMCHEGMVDEGRNYPSGFACEPKRSLLPQGARLCWATNENLHRLPKLWSLKQNGGRPLPSARSFLRACGFEEPVSAVFLHQWDLHTMHLYPAAEAFGRGDVKSANPLMALLWAQWGAEYGRALQQWSGAAQLRVVATVHSVCDGHIGQEPLRSAAAAAFRRVTGRAEWSDLQDSARCADWAVRRAREALGSDGWGRWEGNATEAGFRAAAAGWCWSHWRHSLAALALREATLALPAVRSGGVAVVDAWSVYNGTCTLRAEDDVHARGPRAGVLVAAEAEALLRILASRTR